MSPERARVLRERLCEAATIGEKFKLLEAFLLKRMIRPWDPAIEAAVGLLERGVPVAEARVWVGLLPKTFVRRFREKWGSPQTTFAGAAAAANCRVGLERERRGVVHDYAAVRL
jgi:hypothetical protein